MREFDGDGGLGLHYEQELRIEKPFGLLGDLQLRNATTQ